MNTHVDMTQFIAPKSDQLNADDLIAGPRTIRITGVSANEGSPEQPISVSFEGDDRKPYKPCKSMRRVMVHIWGADASKYVGRAMTLYRDPKVQFGGMQVGGIRISHMTDIPPEKLSDGKVLMALTATRAKRAPYTVLPLKDAPGMAAKPDAATNWANAYVAKVEEAETTEQLEAFVSEKAGKLAELQTKRPELHERCTAAVDARRQALKGDEAFGEDFSSDAPTDDWTAKADELLASISTARNGKYLDAIADDYREVCQDMPKPLCDRIEAALAAKRKAVGASA